MNISFEVSPDLQILSQYGYTITDRRQAGKTLVEVDSVWELERKIEIEAGFEVIVGKYNLIQWRDTLFYICLVESDRADQLFQYYFYSYSERKRNIELSKLLLFTNPQNQYPVIELKVSSKIETIKIQDTLLIKWISTLVRDSLEQQTFNPTDLSFTWVNGNNGLYTDDNRINYSSLVTLSQNRIRKPGIRERNKALAGFLINVLKFLNKETSLKAEAPIIYTDQQLYFLFEVAELLEWISEDDFDSDRKDYIRTILTNYKSRW